MIDAHRRYERSKTLNVLTELDMTKIVAAARTLDERLEEPGTAPVMEDPLVEERLEAWREALGDEDRLLRRLAWDGLDLESARRVLGPASGSEAPLPGWAAFVERALRLPLPEREDDAPWPEEIRFLDIENPRPFEEVLVPFVLTAREDLSQLAPAFDGILEAEARRSLERNLLQRLVEEAADVFLAAFDAVRAREQTSSWDRLFALADDPDKRPRYLEFVRRLDEGGLKRLLGEYPVLARRLGETSMLWVEANAEFLNRLEADMAELQDVFGSGEDLGAVAEVQPGLSDPHRGGRAVVVLTFASGKKLVYKPKAMGTEAAYFRLLAWLNERGAPLPFKVLAVLDRPTHGWVEFVEHLPCKDEDEARRYFERAGMLLCLLYALEVTDCHYENIIASGEYPVLIDTETLMHHRPVVPTPLGGEDARTLANEQLSESVLRTGLLPRWQLSADGASAYQVSGLGQADEQEVPNLRVPKWTRVNTDRMALEQKPVTLPARTSIPRLDDTPLRLEEHGPQVVDGFRRMYQFLRDHREELLSGPLQELAHEQVRFVFRATRIYGNLQRNLRHRDYLRNGLDRSIYLERLGRAQVPPRGLVEEPDERPAFWPLFAAERQAMDKGDIPFFTARADSDDILISSEETAEGCIKEPSFELVQRRLEALDDEDLEQQVAHIEGTLYAYLAREAPMISRSSGEEGGWSEPPASPEDFIGPALAIAGEIQDRAIRGSDGSAVWISPQFLVQAERFQLQPMDYELYGGTCGVAIFLAAVEQFSPEAGYDELALAALQSLRAGLDRWPERFAEGASIGGASGLGSAVYSLVSVGRLLDEPALVEDAQRVAGLISEDHIAGDRALDVIAGSAGAILSLLALQETRPSKDVLNKATQCGEHLLEKRTESPAGPRAWGVFAEKMNTGFSHGAAGIAYALLRLYEHTGDARFLDAAGEAVAYEQSEYSPEMKNWADYRLDDDEVGYPWQWCRGGTGVGLARLGGLGSLDNRGVREDIEVALTGTREIGVQGVDYPCCGTLGRAEVLLEAGETLQRPEFTEAARTLAWQTLARAEKSGGFALHPMLPKQVDAPGFFQGEAGIGYELLRMARPEQLPSVLMWE
ncbi:MAG: type 2 lanthipeptide synthetase LanM family protein [Rubrobacteraceae bacterium]